MNRPSRPAVEATVGSKAPSLVGAEFLLDFKVDVSLDGETLTAEEIERLLAATDGLAMLRGKWVEVDHERLKAALERLNEVERLARQEGVSFGQAMRLLAGAEIGSAKETLADPSFGYVRAGAWLAETLAACRRPEALAAANPGEALTATLRPYQDVGVCWLGFLSRLGLGACLADDMGLGKTIQVLGLLLSLQPAPGRTTAEPPRCAGFASRQLGGGGGAIRSIAQAASSPILRSRPPTAWRRPRRRSFRRPISW